MGIGMNQARQYVNKESVHKVRSRTLGFDRSDALEFAMQDIEQLAKCV